MTDTQLLETSRPGVEESTPLTLANLDSRIDRLSTTVQGLGEFVSSVREEQELHVQGLDRLNERVFLRPALREALDSGSPESYMRIKITKNTKGYSFETTVSGRIEGVDGSSILQKVMPQMLIDADTIARQEIERRELLGSGALDEAARQGMLADMSVGPDVAMSR